MNLSYLGFGGRILRMWDNLVYRLAVPAFRRKALDNRGWSYLIELHIRAWNEKYPPTDEIKRLTENFYQGFK